MAKRPVLDIDADLTNADWPKQSWDLPVSTVGELRRHLKAQGITIAQFKRLPVYRLNVSKLAWLRKL